MKLYEYQAKQLLAQYNFPLPAGKVAENANDAFVFTKNLGRAVVVKGQVHSGGRGKAGAVKVAQNEREAAEITTDLVGKTLFFAQANADLRIDRVLVEEALAIDKEIYVAITQDRATQRDVLIFSMMGGMDIEAVADEHPEAISKVFIDPWMGLTEFMARNVLFDAGFDPALVSNAIPLLQLLYRVYAESDSTLAEINPLVITKDGRIIAGDAKWLIDDNALFRHPELNALADEAGEDPIEAEAHRRGIQYVRLEGGTVGIIGNGAGLVMTTMDEVKLAGGTPADFLDIGGGAKAESVRSSLEVVLSDPHVKAVLFNIFGGITRGDEVAQGILDGLSTLDVNVPIVVRLAGTRSAEGIEILKSANLASAATMQDAARIAVEMAAK